MKRFLLVNILLLLLALTWISPGFAVPNGQLSDIWYQRQPDKFRIGCEFDRECKFTVKTLDTPGNPRVLIDIEGARINPGAFAHLGSNNDYSLTVSDPLVRKVRFAQNENDTVRIVLDLTRMTTHKVVSLIDKNRMILDFKREARGPGGRADKIHAIKTRAVAKPAPIKRIIIDPGHGGNDSGALGYGLKEKDVVLDIALQFREIIKAKKIKNMKVLLTRTKDTYPGLQERIDFSIRNKGDLFISLHLNSTSNRKRRKLARGVEVFSLSDKASTDPEVQALVKEENASDERAGVKASRGSEVEAFMQTMLTESAMLSCQDLADFILPELTKGLKFANRGWKQAPFKVLKNLAMPSVLVEVGFISSSHDTKVLRTKSGRRKVAESLYRAINKYFAKAGDQEIFVSEKLSSFWHPVQPKVVSNKIHIVRKGDNLSLIANRYRGVSVASIKRANSLRSNTIRPGDRLIIPAR